MVSGHPLGVETRDLPLLPSLAHDDKEWSWGEGVWGGHQVWTRAVPPADSGDRAPLTLALQGSPPWGGSFPPGGTSRGRILIDGVDICSLGLRICGPVLGYPSRSSPAVGDHQVSAGLRQPVQRIVSPAGVARIPRLGYHHLWPESQFLGLCSFLGGRRDVPDE